ncbi:head decoration protein [Nocardia rhizosphaerihabitans]|uniref:head decoration protein n=1 Tax=Nocardia rhizosphaerihabitans TaxID=1691570 RepID=UPI00366B7DBD
MTSIALQTGTTYVGEKRSWLQGPHGTGPNENPNATLDVSKFVEATHYPDGHVWSGTVLGRVTATGLYGPYDEAAVDGRNVAAGHLFSSLVLKGKTKVAGALVVHGFVDAAKLPANHGLDANGRADLKHIVYTN